MTARNDMEAATWAAMAKHRQALAEGTWQRAADNEFVDTVLKAADKYALGAAEVKRRAHVNAKALDAALAKVRAAG